ncbi:adenine phosphoribosyltransferase [Heterostelium album PN500]|uniref:adenine phosphoribosyltransferase n=1 Tax=Heterostelium pallidum (strain ATCC 26659 / Pp 5 / PN500) TaxID=670386 RepID=D3B538_HETP5|nr:adenine phosphoribosyltransferase [Heterostelium album PN500]EFA83403.1 adenine phosphoribosyltransferase [Heterostelium album PN500]|eukprot:XP_020435520.1 adenine phosphoribosyltransferase [Heterostelium album PN500]
MDGYEKLQSCAKKAVIKRSVTYPDWPNKGVSFLDISPLFLSYEDFDTLINYWQYRFQDVQLVVGLEARGFILATAISQRLKIPMMMMRKKGKLPGKTLSESYTKEYGKDEFEIQEDVFRHLSPATKSCKNFHVLIVDDILATGGTLCASIELVRKLLKANSMTNAKISTSLISSIKCLKGKENIYEKYNDVSIDVIHEI